MKNGFLILVIVVLFFNCNVKKDIENTPTIVSIKTNANTLLDEWHQAASEANYEGYFAKMDSLSVFIGTDATENWSKTQFQKFSKPFFDKGKAWSFKPLERNVYVNEAKDFVWFDELLTTWMGTCRGSGVLEKKQNVWKIKHYVLSVEIPNNDIQAVILAKKKSDSIFLSTINK
ncbi:nuclear transport factor 2 family protein [Polaribacter sp. AHE13PA]|uniref:nuclear transport factor 2 family protein n=1 Tax=Polaribacter sp. AHE13PA TaxID=2745562 RepID=UPI001C4F4BD8|nr:nuclear transport factor 2 family protein [Polaribacter sp. AHE13PA]QXP66847.1 nuclear transport factor 2 family protein [Polaribacter sp. AHE13PA]